KFLHGPALAHVGTGSPRMLEQNVVEYGSLDLDGFGLAIVFALAEGETVAECAVAELEPRAEFSWEACRLQGGQHAHLAEEGHVAGQQGFADVEARENFFFQDEHAFARARQESGGAAAARAATDDHRVV